jgi:hypothetical protein
LDDLLQHPAVQAGVAPLLVGLVIAAALWRTRFAWFAVAAAYATAVMLSTGLAFQPLTAGRKVTLAVLLAPFIGAALDAWPRPPRWLWPALAVLCGALACWVFASLLAQREGGDRVLVSLGLLVFVAGLIALTLRLRDDGIAAGSAGVAGALAVGVAALLSASIGYFVGGIAMAAGAGALLALQFVLKRAQTPGYTGTLPVGLGLGLFATASVLLAQMPWFVLPLLALVPWAAYAGSTRGATLRARVFTAAGLATATAVLFVAAVWLAGRATAAPST